MTTAAQRGHLSFALAPGPLPAMVDTAIGAVPSTRLTVPTDTTFTTSNAGHTAATTSLTLTQNSPTATIVVGDYIMVNTPAGVVTPTHVDGFAGEVMRVTALSGGSPQVLTVVRGVMGTVAKAIPSSALAIWKIPHDTNVATDANYWWTMPFTGASLAISEMTDMLPPELGSTLFTRGGYKAGAFMAGSAQLEIRLEKYFGKMLQVMAGTTVTTAPEQAGGWIATYQVNGTVGASATANTITVDSGLVVVPGDILGFHASNAGNPNPEKVLVTAVTSATVLQVVRGYDNTAIGAITDNDYVYRYKRNAVTIFQPDVTNEPAAPYLHARRYVPDSTGTAGYTEYGFDGRGVSLSMALPQAGAARAEFSAVFRRPFSVDGEFETNGSTAVVGSSIPGIAESAASLVLSCTSNVAFPALGIKGAADGVFMGAQIQIANITISPQDGMGIGAYYPEDWTILSRGASVRLAYKWKDEALYNTIVYAGDGASFGAWAPQLKYSDVCVQMKAASNAPVGGCPYELDFFIPNAALNMSAPTLLSGKFITTEMVAVASWNGITRGAPWMAFLYNDATY